MKNNLEKMKQTDVKTIDINTLVDIEKITIDEDMSKEEKIQSYIKQIKNPYCFRCGDIVVKVSYADEGATLEEKIETLILAL